MNLLTTGLQVYNSTQGKESLLSPEEKALAEATLIVVQGAAAIIAKPEFKTVAMQAQLTADMEKIRKQTGN